MANFLDLPAELRNRIYHLYLAPAKSFHCNRQSGLQEPSLLKTSRQIRSRTLFIHYGTNTFYVARNESVISILQHLGSNKTAMLHTVQKDLTQCFGMRDACEFAAWISEVRLQEYGFGVPAEIFYVPLECGEYATNGVEKIKRIDWYVKA